MSRPSVTTKARRRLRYARPINHASARSSRARERPTPGRDDERLPWGPVCGWATGGVACSAQVEHVLILCMDYGLVLFTSDRGITPAAAAKVTDDHGFTTLLYDYMPEHTHIPMKREAAHPTTDDESLPDDRYMRTLDPWVSLGAACAVTSRVRLSTAVALPVEHDPITLAKSIATLDHLSGGRVQPGRRVRLEHRRTGRPQRAAGAPPHHAARVPGSDAGCGRRKKPNTTASSSSSQLGLAQAGAVAYPGAGGCGGHREEKWIARSADGWITTSRDLNIDEPVKLLQDTWAAADHDSAPQIVRRISSRCRRSWRTGPNSG